MSEDQGPLENAERQMIERQMAAFAELSAKLSRGVGFDPDQLPTLDEMRQALGQLIDEDPEARDLAERLAIHQQFHGRPGAGEEE